MSRYFAKKLSSLTPYVPGEQPQNRKYIKLNTNESPYPPSKTALTRAKSAAESLMLYPDPDYTELRKKLAECYHVLPENIVVGNGSDEILNFAFTAFGENGMVFPDISYGFYPVFANLHGIPYREIPLDAELNLIPSDYYHAGKTVIIANPNAPSGRALNISELESIIQQNPDNLVIIDEAYVDFGAESAVSLIPRYDNLLVVQTFSKSRSFAGARFGYGIGSAAVIADLNTVRCSTNPYNVSRITAAAAVGALEDEAYTRENCKKIIATRTETVKELRNLGFIIPESSANFVFAKHPDIDGALLYQKLKDQGILVRHFQIPKISAYIRITIGSDSQMKQMIAETRTILQELHS